MDDDQDGLEPSYERALFADLDRLLNAIPHNEIAVQWDVAVVFAVLEGRFEGTPGPAHRPQGDAGARRSGEHRRRLGTMALSSPPQDVCDARGLRLSAGRRARNRLRRLAADRFPGE